MNDRRSHVELDVTLGRGGAPEPLPPETPFHVAILGDFSGRGSVGETRAGQGAPTIGGPFFVDRDDLEDVLARLAPRARIILEDGQTPIEVSFSELDDFHPDTLLRSVPTFRELEDRWSRLVSEDLFAPPPVEPEAPTSLDLTGAGLLDQVVHTSLPDEESDLATRDPLQALVARLVAPHRIANLTPEQIRQQLDLDEAKHALMNAILHDPAFQHLERVWRGMDFLVRRVDTGPRLKLFVIDVPKSTLADAHDDDGPGTVLTRALDEAAGALGAPWAAVIGLHAFESDDVDLLSTLGHLGSSLGAPFIAAAPAALTGFDSFDTTPEAEVWRSEAVPAWDALRRSPAAAWLGLAAPRFLLREPYGSAGEPSDLRGFEEELDHGSLSWGNPALLVALILSRAFEAEGWHMRPDRSLVVDGLPLHVRRVDGAPAAIPCAECVMAESVASKIAESGVMPVAWLRDEPRVRLVRTQSATAPPGALRGRWVR